jgi:protein-tyrosine phosphatase
VLVVGDGNVARSAYVERRLAWLLDGSGVRVASAGIEADEGRSMDRVLKTRLEKAGGSGTRFVARQLTIELVASADLLLAVTRRLRGEAAQLHYPAVRYSFTLQEFADLVRDLEPGDIDTAEGGSWVAKVATAAGQRRGYVATRRRSDVDLPEAVSPGSVRGMTRRVEQALPAVVAALTPPRLNWAQRATMDLEGPSR